MKILSATLLLLPATATAQVVGGGYDTQLQLTGPGNEDLGRSVCGVGDVNGDGIDDLALSAPRATPSGFYESGAVFIYSGDDGSLLHTWYGEHSQDLFGYAVSAAGDVNGDGFADVLIGAPYARPSSFRSGMAYVYSGADGSIIHKWYGRDSNHYLGWSVSGAGDVDGDGFDDILLGAPALPGASVIHGKVSLMSGADGSGIHLWVGEIPGDRFGFSVSGAGDVNNDGVPDVVVGAKDADPNGLYRAGSVFVFSGADASTIHQWNGNVEEDGFGVSVSDVGDVNHDGFDDVIVGKWADSPLGTNWSGGAMVYSGVDGSMLYQWIGVRKFEDFGSSVSGAGDVNQDGTPDLIVGARRARFAGNNEAGAAFVYSGVDGSLLLERYGSGESSFFGQSVASAGDLDGNGFADVIIGATRLDPSNGILSGGAIVIGFKSYMESSTATISASAGGTIDLNLDFPVTAESYRYKVLISASGTGPMTFGVDIPLTHDSLVNDTYFGRYPASNSNLQGTLNADGDASGSMTLPAGINASLIGSTFHVATIANAVGQLPEFSSVAAAITITP